MQITLYYKYLGNWKLVQNVWTKKKEKKKVAFLWVKVIMRKLFSQKSVSYCWTENSLIEKIFIDRAVFYIEN